MQQLDAFPLWTFSVGIYRKPGVAAACLSLQNDLGIDVNLLLFCAYVGAQERAMLDDNDIKEVRAIVYEWHSQIVCGLRTVRQLLKSWTAAPATSFQQSITQLRSNAKGLELNAERIEQAMLAEWLETNSSRWIRGESTASTLHNVRLIIASYGDFQCGEILANADLIVEAALTKSNSAT